MFSRYLRRPWEDLCVLLLTGLFAAGLCLIPPTLQQSMDYVFFYRANFQFLTDAVREGRVPLWNPYIQLGRPYLADMQNAVFYPPVYLMCLGQVVGGVLLTWFHCFVAVIGMRSLARALQAGRWQGYFMALSFLASGALTGCWALGAFAYWWGLCYVPVLFYCAARTGEPWKGRRIGQHGLLLALQFLCGHPQVFWFTAVGQLVFVGGRALRPPLRQGMLHAGRSLCQFAAACLLGAGLVAAVLLPFLELVAHGNRVGSSPAYANSFALAWRDVETLLYPAGLSAAPCLERHNLFVGPIVLLLGMAGLCLVRERNVRGLLAVGVVALLMAVGEATPCFWLFYECLPGYGSFRCHQREGLLVALVLICATGIWLSGPHPRLRALWEHDLGVPIRSVAIVLVVLQGLGLMWATWFIKRGYAYAALYQSSPDFPFEQALVGRLRKEGLLEPSHPPPRICVPTGALPANYGMIDHYSSFDAYTSLFLRRPWDYLHRTLGIEPPQALNTSVSQDIYARGPFPWRDLGLVAGVDVARESFVVNTNPAPRAFLVYAAEVVGDYDAVLKRLVQGHDIRRSALLERPLAEPLSAEGALPAAAATIRRFEPNWLLVEVDAKTNALLVVAEDWYPGWHAEISGKDYACVPANLWMRAIPVPAGRHTVRLYFRQNYLLPGLLISLASLCVLVVLMVRPRGQVRKSQVILR